MDKYLFQLRRHKTTFFHHRFRNSLPKYSYHFSGYSFGNCHYKFIQRDSLFSCPSLFFWLYSSLSCTTFPAMVKERISFRFAEKTSEQIQGPLIRKLFEIGPRGIGKFGSGNMITLCLEGIPSFRTYLELFIPRAIAMVCIPIVVLLYTFNFDIISGIVLLLTMPILIAFLILLGMVAQKYANTQWSSYQLLSRHFVDSLRGLLTLKYLGRSQITSTRY